MIKNIEFIKAAHNLEQVLPGDMPEAVMLGRSNVGKSSFINSVFNRKNLAKTGATPGKTRSINYYMVEKKFYLVDLPGYGYAKISKSEREHFKKLIGTYLLSERNIAVAFHLIDARHKPSDLDVEFNDILRSYQIPYVAVLSKTDKLNQSELSQSVKVVRSIFPELLLHENLIPFSAFSSRGHKEIHARLSALFEK